MAFGVEKCDKSPQSWILDSTPWIQDSLSKGTWVPDPNLYRDSGFFKLSSGQSQRLRMPQANSRISESV